MKEAKSGGAGTAPCGDPGAPFDVPSGLGSFGFGLGLGRIVTLDALKQVHELTLTLIPNPDLFFKARKLLLNILKPLESQCSGIAVCGDLPREFSPHTNHISNITRFLKTTVIELILQTVQSSLGLCFLGREFTPHRGLGDWKACKTG